MERKRVLGCLVMALSVSIVVRAQSSLRIQSSMSVADALGDSLREGFNARYADIVISWESAGSGSVFSRLFAGEVDLGVSSRSIRSDEIDLARRLGLDVRELVLGLEGLAVVVHPDNDVPSLSLSQLASLYTGRMARWLGVGGADEPVHLVSPREWVGTEAVFRELVFADPDQRLAGGTEYLATDAEILDRVESVRGAIGFVSMVSDRSRVRTVPIAAGPEGEPQLPSVYTVNGGIYALRHPLWIYLIGEPDRELMLFLRFLYLHDGPSRVATAGYVPVQSFGAMSRTLSARSRPEVSVTRIGFGFNSVRLNAEARRNLMAIALRLSSTGEGLWITGHREPGENRPDLASSRAREVADFLEEQSIELTRMMVSGRGVAEPVASSADRASRAANRRVDVWILLH